VDTRAEHASSREAARAPSRELLVSTVYGDPTDKACRKLCGRLQMVIIGAF